MGKSATFRIHFLHFGHSVQFAIVNFLLESAVAYGSGYGSYDGKGNQANNQYPHTFSFLEKKCPYTIERTKIHIVFVSARF